jgi:hypothetical protein
VPRAAVSHIALAADGTIYLDAHKMDSLVLIIPPDGSEPRAAPRKNRKTYDLAVDGRGRARLATDSGVEVYGSDGRALAPRWLRSLGESRHLLILGEGPALR